jgi:hypothetical protein
MRPLTPCLALVPWLLAAAAAHGTEPGTPMDCSDLELAPGLTCTEVTNPTEDLVIVQDGAAFDNDGRYLVAGWPGAVVGSCGSTELEQRNLIVSFDSSGSATTLVSSTDRCVDPSIGHFERVSAASLDFDPVRGSVLLGAFSRCGPFEAPQCPYGPSTASLVLAWTARIDGFTPLADVLAPLPLCANGIDDDDDGDIDLDDAHCKSESDNDESRP